MAAGGAGGGRGRQVRRGRWISGGAGHEAADGADDGSVAGSGRAVRTAACARMPPVVAVGLSAHSLDGGDWARRRHGGGVAGRGTARSGRDRGLCGGAQRACVDRVVLARAAGMKGSVG